MATDRATGAEYDPSNIEVRTLPAEELHKLKGLGPNDDWIPSPETGTVLVFEKDGEIISFIVAQLAVHLEPIWVRGDYRATPLPLQTWIMGMEMLKNNKLGAFFTFAENEAVAEYLERLGLERLKPIPFFGGTGNDLGSIDRNGSGAS